MLANGSRTTGFSTNIFLKTMIIRKTLQFVLKFTETILIHRVCSTKIRIHLTAAASTAAVWRHCTLRRLLSSPNTFQSHWWAADSRFYYTAVWIERWTRTCRADLHGHLVPHSCEKETFKEHNRILLSWISIPSVSTYSYSNDNGC